MKPNTKKLIYILNSYSETESSHFFHVMGLLDALAARGIYITLIIEKAKSLPTFTSPNISVIALKNQYRLLRLFELFSLVIRLIRQGYTRSYVRISAVTTLAASLAHSLFGGRAFLWQSGTTLEYDLSQPLSLKKIRWYFSSYLLNKAARSFVQCFVTGPAFMVDYYAKVAKVKSDKIRLLYNDIDVERFAPINPVDAAMTKSRFLIDHGFDSDALVLLLVHRLSPVRRTTLYFPACLNHLKNLGLLDGVVMIIAGDGPELAAVKELADQYSVAEHCIFLGSVPNREIENLYHITDIFLHPTYNEGFPRVLLEAMASGLPIVTTDAGGTLDLLGLEQRNYVVSRDKPEDFANRLSDIICDAEIRNKLGKENLSHVQHYSTKNVAKMYEEVLFS